MSSALSFWKNKVENSKSILRGRKTNEKRGFSLYRYFASVKDKDLGLLENSVLDMATSKAEIEELSKSMDLVMKEFNIFEYCAKEPKVFDPNSAFFNSVSYRKEMLEKFVDNDRVNGEDKIAFLILSTLSGIVSTKSRMMMVVNKMDDHKHAIESLLRKFCDYTKEKAKGSSAKYTIHNLRAAFPDYGFLGRCLAYGLEDYEEFDGVKIPKVLAYPGLSQLNISKEIAEVHKKWEEFYWTKVIKSKDKNNFNVFNADWYDVKSKDAFWVPRIEDYARPKTPYTFTMLKMYHFTVLRIRGDVIIQNPHKVRMLPKGKDEVGDNDGNTPPLSPKIIPQASPVTVGRIDSGGEKGKRLDT